MKLIKYSLVVLLLLSPVAIDEASAIRINEDPKKVEKSAEEKASDELAKKTKDAVAKDENGQPSKKSPFCTLEGKQCRERAGYKASDDEGDDSELEEPQGMVRSAPGIVGDSEANKASKGEPKELKINGTVKVEMAKWFPNREKLARINATKIAIKKEEEKREADKKQREEDRKERKKERAKAKPKVQIASNATAMANQTAQAQTNATISSNQTAQTNQTTNVTAVVNTEKPVQVAANATAIAAAPVKANATAISAAPVKVNATAIAAPVQANASAIAAPVQANATAIAAPVQANKTQAASVQTNQTQAAQNITVSAEKKDLPQVNATKATA